MATTLSPVNSPTSLEKLAYDAIKNAILTFQLKPGESLVEADLAGQLGISKTPVRDALLRLEKESLVVKIPYKGSYVAGISRDIVIDLFEIRAVLEGLAARLSMPFISVQNLAELKEIIMRHERALRDGDITEASKHNRKFHQTIIQPCPNDRLLQILGNLDDHLQRFRLLSNYQRGTGLKSVDEHRVIYAALERHDGAAVEAAMRSHLTNVLTDLSEQDFDQLVELVSSKATHQLIPSQE